MAGSSTLPLASPSKTAQFPAMPKCTWTQTSSASPLPNHAKRFLPTASMARKGLLLMAAAPSVKRPFGRRAGKLLADEADAVAGRDAVDGVAFDHSYLCPEWCRAPGSGSNREQREDVGHEVRRSQSASLASSNSSEALICFGDCSPRRRVNGRSKRAQR